MDPEGTDAELDRLRRAAFSRDGTSEDLAALREAERAAAGPGTGTETGTGTEPEMAIESSTEIDVATEAESPPTRARRVVPVVLGLVLALVVIGVLWPRPSSAPESAGLTVVPEPTTTHVPIDPADERTFVSALPTGSAPIDPDDPEVRDLVAGVLAPNGVEEPTLIGEIDGWTYYSGRNGDVSVCFFRFVTDVDEGRCVTPAEFDSVGVIIPAVFLDLDQLDSANREISGSITLRPDQTIAFDLVPPSELAAR